MALSLFYGISVTLVSTPRTPKQTSRDKHVILFKTDRQWRCHPLTCVAYVRNALVCLLKAQLAEYTTDILWVIPSLKVCV